MPKAILLRDVNERVLYDSKLSWAARGLMVRLLTDEQNVGEIYFADNDWKYVHDLLNELEANDYIRYPDNGDDKFNIYIL